MCSRSHLLRWNLSVVKRKFSTAFKHNRINRKIEISIAELFSCSLCVPPKPLAPPQKVTDWRTVLHPNTCNEKELIRFTGQLVSFVLETPSEFFSPAANCLRPLSALGCPTRTSSAKSEPRSGRSGGRPLARWSQPQDCRWCGLGQTLRSPCLRKRWDPRWQRSGWLVLRSGRDSGGFFKLEKSFDWDNLKFL